MKKSGSWFTYNGDQLGQGKEKVRLYLKENPAIADEIEQKIFAKLGVGGHAEAEATPAETSKEPVDVVPNVDFDDES